MFSSRIPGKARNIYWSPIMCQTLFQLFSCYLCWLVMMPVIIFVSIDKEAKAMRYCVACTDSHSWKRVGRGLEENIDIIDSKSNVLAFMLHQLSIASVMLHDAWQATTKPQWHATVSAYCSPPGSAGSQPGPSAVLGWVFSHMSCGWLAIGWSRLALLGQMGWLRLCSTCLSSFKD